MLLEDAHLQPVGLTSTLSFKQKAEFENAATFLDDTDALYRFVSSFLEALLYFNNFFCDNIKQSNCMNVLFCQSALRHSAQNEPLELEISDGSSDSEDEIPRDQVLLKNEEGSFSAGSLKDGQDSCEAYKMLSSLFIQRSYYDDTINDTLQSLGKEHTVVE